MVRKPSSPDPRAGLPAADESSAEISMLIRTLRDSDHRLDELTSGQMDSAIDRDGQSFLLHRAQRELRAAEAAKQAAILNALPAHILLLDADGRIVALNDAWHALACSNSLLDPRYGIGTSYLAACDEAQGAGAADAHRAAAGIRAVLKGTSRRYAMEYTCRSGTEQLWFVMTAAPLHETPPNGAVVMHVDITDQKRGEVRSFRFGTAMNAVVDSVYLVDRATMRYVHVNDAACRLQKKTREELMAMGPEVVLGVSLGELQHLYDALIAGGVEAKPVELLRRRADGSNIWVEIRRQAQHSGYGWTIITLVRDITRRKAAEERIAYLNRVYAMLSGINTLIVRKHGRDELLQEACRIAVESGGFRMALIGVVDKASKKVTSAGLACMDQKELAIVQAILVRAGGVPTPMTAQAIAEKRVIVSNDSHTDPRVAHGRKHVEFGVRSMAIFPFIVADEVVGVLSLYATESQFFHAEELKLLTELTNDIAFAIDHIEKRERLDYIAYYDVLTGLANRSLFLDRMTQLMRGAKDSGHKLALLLIDLQRFRNVNDSLGRSAGDALLRQVAQWLSSKAQDTNLLARVGIDLFAAILPNDIVAGDLARYLEDNIGGFEDHPFVLNGTPFRIAVKVGIALYPDDGTGTDDLYAHAEAALNKAKAGGERYLFYTQKMTEAVAGKLILENQLHQALDKEQFVLHYQPKVHLVSGLITGVEALIRWNDPQRGLVSPALFIPLLEETGLIHEVGRWALRKAIEDYLRWRAMGLAAVPVAVNVSALQLHERNFSRVIEQAIAVDPHAAAGLELEITESLIMADIEHNIDTLRAIRSMGVSIAIDDFGTGFSSLNYLAKLPVHTLKIDRSFVMDLTPDPQKQVLVSTIITLAHSLRLNVVAEGVETEQQSRLLRLMLCDEMQGYLFSRPLPREVLERQFLGASAAAEAPRRLRLLP
jgi:diguanylate cyclase (GGDEF)-like protein/PAS domain S-box-containing protein